MVGLAKSLGKAQLLSVLLVVIGTIFCLGSCRNSSSESQSVVDAGDEKLSAEKVQEGDALYAGREDLAKARVAVAALRQARTADYGNFEAAWKLARACYYVGDHTDNTRESDDMFRDGIEAGKAAVKLQPNKAEGHFWLGANYGGSAAHSTLAGLSNIQDIRQEMEAVIKIDEGFQSGSAYMALGRLYLQAPRLLGGDTTKAISYLEKGLRFGPSNALLRFYLAQAYESAGRDADARKQIQAVLALAPDPNYVAEQKDAVEQAKKLLQKMDAR